MNTCIHEKILDDFVLIDGNSLTERNRDIFDQYGFIKWNDYFPDQKFTKLLSVDKNFMIEHGKYLVNKSTKIIKQYIKLWTRLIVLSLNNRSVGNDVKTIHLTINDKGYYMISFEEKRMEKFVIYFFQFNDYKPSSKKKYPILSIYDELRNMLLTTNFDDVHISIKYDGILLLS